MTMNMTALWDALGWAILHSLWQGALIGFVVWAIRTLATQRRAWLRYLAGMGGLVATFGAFLATFMILAISRVEKMVPIDQAGDLAGPSAASDLTLSISVLPLQASQSGLAEALVPWLGMIWAVGFAFLSLQSYRAYAATRWLATRGLRSPCEDWTARFTALIRRSRTNEKIRLFVSEYVSGPMTLGALRPIVLVPVGFLTALPPAQIEAILLHELAHIRRHDFLFGLIQTAIRTVLYFNPAVVMMSRQIDEDREQACDDFAVSITGNAADLARGLAALRLGSQKPDLVMAADGGPLLARLNRLMGRPATRSASSRLTAAAISALLLGTAACSTVSMAHPHPPEAPESPRAPDSADLPDTIIRGGKVITGDRIILSGPDGAGPALVLHDADLAAHPASAAFPTLPAMPPMPAVPATPVLPAVPSPVPVFGDYKNEAAFEAAMEEWEKKMEAWGEVVEQQFEGDWENRMEAWGEEMEAWSEAVEDMSEEYAENSDGERFQALAELKGLANLVELEDLADLTALKDGVWVLDDGAVDAKADEIRGRVLKHVESRIRDIDWNTQRAEQERERAVHQAERAANQAERAAERAVRAQQRQIELVERQIEQAERQAERQVELAERQAERAQRQGERAKAQALAESHRTHASSSSHSQHTITVSGAEAGETVVINGRKLDVDRFRRTVMTALVEDGLIQRGDRSVTLSMCDDTLDVDGRTASNAQTKRYAKIFANAGLDTTESLVVKLKPEVLTLSMSGDGKKDVQKVSVGTFNHTDTK